MNILIPIFSLLHHLKILPADNRLMIVFDEVHSKFALILLAFSCQKIFGETFLHQHITDIFLVGQNSVNCRCTPNIFSGYSFDTVFFKIFLDFTDTKALKVQLKDFPDNYRL